MSFNINFLKQQTEVYADAEKKAEEMYEALIGGVKDNKIIDVLDHIRVDEIKHQKIVKQIQEILDKYN